DQLFHKVESIQVHMYGSLSLTGKGHATDLAVLLGLSGTDPEYVPIESIDGIVKQIKKGLVLNFNNETIVEFDPEKDLIFHRDFLPFHANGMRFAAMLDDGNSYEQTYYSIGGGFVVKEELYHPKDNLDIIKQFPFPIDRKSTRLNSSHV